MADETASTWQKSLRWFLLGLLRAVILTMTPVAWLLWKWVYAWGDYKLDWSTVWQLAVTCGAPAAALYWHNHRYLLKVPPALVIPDEFLETNPKIQVTKSTAVTVPTDSGGTRTVTVEEKEPAKGQA